MLSTQIRILDDMDSNVSTNKDSNFADPIWILNSVGELDAKQTEWSRGSDRTIVFVVVSISSCKTLGEQ